MQNPCNVSIWEENPGWRGKTRPRNDKTTTVLQETTASISRNVHVAKAPKTQFGKSDDSEITERIAFPARPNQRRLILDQGTRWLAVLLFNELEHRQAAEALYAGEPASRSRRKVLRTRRAEYVATIGSARRKN